MKTRFAIHPPHHLLAGEVYFRQNSYTGGKKRVVRMSSVNTFKKFQISKYQNGV